MTWTKGYSSFNFEIWIGRRLGFARSGLLELLRRVVHQLIIPAAVKSALWTLTEAEWIKEQHVLNSNLVESLPRKLHTGEREAIVLAQELGSALLVDDRAARREAQRLGIAHFGSLRILKEAKERGFIGALEPAWDDLVRSGRYIGAELYREFLEAGRRAGYVISGVSRRIFRKSVPKSSAMDLPGLRIRYAATRLLSSAP